MAIVRRAMSHCQPPTEKCAANDRANEPNPPRVTPPEPDSEAVPDDEELDEELKFHVEMLSRKNLASGMTADEANRRARIQFGVGDAIKEECRDARRLSFIETSLQDMRYALRGFRRTPLFALTVVATIAIGVLLGLALVGLDLGV